MQKAHAIIVFLLLACVSAVAGASEAAVKAAFQKKYPDVVVESVVKTPLPGIYEIFANGDLIYADEKVAHLFVNATLVDTEKKVSLTEERKSKLTAIKFDQLPLNLAVKRVKGKGTRKLAYFADPNCGYCKKFEQDLTKINDVTIYVFFFPVLGAESIEKAKSIWCSKDRIKAWDDQLVRNIAPTAPGTCATPIDKIVEFGKQKRINGTPTMFFADGQRIPGAIPTDQIEQRLTVASQTK